MAERDDSVRVLVVDDNPDEAGGLAALLTLNGYAVQVCTDAQHALALLPGFDPQCLMLDIDMPGMSGVELAATLRRGAADDLVIIAVTGWGAEDPIASAAFDHFDYCLRKPVDPRRLEQLLPPLRAR